VKYQFLESTKVGNRLRKGAVNVIPLCVGAVQWSKNISRRLEKYVVREQGLTELLKISNV
jgi:hypothetical protein